MSPFQHVVSNAGPLMVLAKLHILYLLVDLYETMHIPTSVYQKVVIQGLRYGYEDALTLRQFLQEVGWSPENVSNDNLPPLLRDAHLDQGERDALTLALQLKHSLVLMDERQGRLVARQLGLPVRGSVGILVQSYRHGILTERHLRWYLKEIEERSDIWINPRLVRRVREEIFGDK